MEEITFLDVLSHYRMKLLEISDHAESIQTQIKKAEGHIEMGWSGQAADACRLKLDAVQSEMNKTLAELSEALAKLSAIGDLLAEDDIPTI